MKSLINQEIINFANHLADQSAIIAKKYFRLANGEEAKSDDSPVTKADREIELMIRQKINNIFPNHGIIGEEYENINEKAQFVWVIDPIDGTSSFIIGRPIFGTLISLTYNKKPILGIINQPITNERWFAADGFGAWFTNKNIAYDNQIFFDNKIWQKIKTRNVTNLNDAVMCSSSPHFFEGVNKNILQHLSKLTKYQKIGGIVYGGDCYSFACLAMGLVDIIIEPGLKCYDYAATQPIIAEAGGFVTDWQGKDLDLKSNIAVLACANKNLLDQVIKEISTKI